MNKIVLLNRASPENSYFFGIIVSPRVSSKKGWRLVPSAAKAPPFGLEVDAAPLTLGNQKNLLVGDPGVREGERLFGDHVWLLTPFFLLAHFL